MKRLGRPLDIASIRLQGRHLIEASAGTGKTWTLTGLYLRLLLETGVQVEDILVVTFTEAATEELRGKLRERLVDGLLAFCGDAGGDAFLRQLVARHRPETAQRKLLRAIRSFDNAPVYTIHGFCRRLLNETALESGIAFDNELLKDDSELRLEAVYDFWRRHLEDGWPWLQAWTPEKLSNQLRQWLGKPDLQVLGCQPEIDEPSALKVVEMAYREAAAIWQSQASEIRQLLETHPGLNRRSYSKKNLPRWLSETGKSLLSGDPLFLPDCIKHFFPAELQSKSTGDPPRHPWFECLQRWRDSHERWKKARQWALAAWRCRALKEVQQLMEESKRQLGVLTFDDLLLQLDQALQGDHGKALAQWARSRYPVALIDEFQDTDPTQYRIFQAIYGGQAPSLFFVGDPKQAIYSFRGADLYAYLQARRETGEVHTLAVNWRSSKPLVTALNRLFTRHPQPFRLPEVPYIEVEAAQPGNPPPADLPPLRIWTLAADKKPWDKQEAGKKIVAAVADDIARRLRYEEIRGSDIAILVRKNAQAGQMRQALAERGVASVLQTTDSVFTTPEADELLRVLEAIAWLHDEERLRAALVTDLIGLTGDDLVQFEAQPSRWETWFECFEHWQQLWRKQGVMALFQDILSRRQVHGRFLQRLDGERRLTNWLHLAELLHRQHLQQSWGMEALIRWFQRLIQEEIRLSDDAELRLESDAQLVQIVTIHRSKGLEYELVYSPFLWEGGSGKIEPPFLFHDSSNDYQACLELGSSRCQEHAQLALEEQRAEELRLAYVALTRAKRHCTVVTGWINSVDQSPIGWLLHGEKLNLETGSWHQMADDLRDLEKACQGNLRCSPLPEPQPVTPSLSMAQDTTGQVRHFCGRIPFPWQVTSYSGLVLGQALEQPDYDQLVPREAEEDKVFPVGSKAGICLHAILEKLDFTRPVAQQRDEVLHPALVRSGFHDIDSGLLCRWLQNVLATPLEPGDSFCLQQLPKDDRLDEMAFYLPVGQMEADRLRALLRDHLPDPGLRQAAARLHASTVRGYLKGFVDLIYRRNGRYWVVDYKSNFLAASPVGYTLEKMTEAVAEAHYYLQYLIYTVALHRFLKLRVKDYNYQQHFGGVYYLFLRGMTPETGPEYGIYRDRPSLALIDALEQWLK